MSERQLLAGWGRTAASVATVVRPQSVDGVAAALGRSGNGGAAIARGLGRAYGDAAQRAGGTVLDMTGLDEIHGFDVQTGRLDAGAGLSLDRLIGMVLPFGWFVPVTPGTRFVTLGGALAADVHGKNHHVDGSFAEHVVELELVTPDGVRRTVSPSVDADVFWATAGGMGLTGVVTRIVVQLQAVATSRIRVDTTRVPDLDALLDRLERTDGAYRYSVAWIDLLARGRATGRAVVSQGDPALPDDLPPRQRGAPLAYGPRPRVTVPRWLPDGLLRPGTVRAFNELWFRKAPVSRVGEIQGLATFFHPLDGVLEWNRVYGPSGFVQYQFVVPDGQEDAVRRAVEAFSGAGTPSFLAVLKRFGQGNEGPLSFPLRGWTLAVDVPAARPGLARLLDRLDDLVVQAGGRVYLAKDSRMRPEALRAMYPRLDAWREVRDRLDPQRVLGSDLSQRLRL